MGQRTMLTAAFLFSLIVLSMLSGCSSFDRAKQPKVVDGVLDLASGWTAGQAVKLDGSWEIYWNELLTPQDFSQDGEKKADYIEVPGSWKEFRREDGKAAGNGYATYRLLVKTQNNQRLGLKIPRIFSAYRLWVNGEQVASAGTVGQSREETTPKYFAQVVLFTSQQENEILLQVANFHYRSGGILEGILLGSEEQILRIRYQRIACEFFLCGSLLMIGVYHILMFCFRRNDRTPLYFGLFCFLLAVRTGLVGERMFVYFAPFFHWEIAQKIQTLTFYLGVPMIATFFWAVFPAYFHRKVIWTIQVVSVAFSSLVLVAPVWISSVVNPVYQLFTIGVIIYLLILFLKNIRQKKTEIWLIVGGGLAIILTSLNDMVFSSIWMNENTVPVLRSVIQTGNLSAVGQVIFVFTNSVMLAKKISGSLKHEESMAKELKAINQNLDNLVKKRTQALEESRRELEKANHTLDLISRKDPLTGLWNRRHYSEVIEMEWNRCLRYKKPMALMIFDIDYFKEYNDSYGHVAGDQCLIQVAQAINALFRRSSDTAVRFGGEEFIVIMPEAGEAEAREMAGRVLKKIEELNIPHETSPVAPRISVSIGVTSIVPEHHYSLEKLVLTADKALYQAKGAGRNRYVYLPGAAEGGDPSIDEGLDCNEKTRNA